MNNSRSAKASGTTVRGQNTARGQREAIRRGRPYKAQQLTRLRADTPSPTSAYFKRKRQEEEEKGAPRKEEQEKARRIGPSPPHEVRRKRTELPRDLSPESQDETGTGREEEQETGEEAQDMDTTKQFEELTKLITGFRDDLKKDNEKIRNEIKELKEEIHRKEQEWKEEKEEISKEVRDLKDKIKEKDSSINWLLDKEEMRDRRERKNNVVISGWKAPGKEPLTTEVAKFLKDSLRADVGVVETRGAGGRGERNRLIVAKINSWEEKQEIMKKKSTLKQTGQTIGGEGKAIYIDHDRTYKEREIRRLIHLRAVEETEKGRTTKEGYMKLTINGVTWNWNDNTWQLEEEKRQENFRN